MRAEKNTELRITISKSQDKWLRMWCKKHNTTPSKYLSYLLIKKTEELAAYLRLQNGDQEELDNLIKLARVPWLDED